MNNHIFVNIDRPLAWEALRILQEVPGITAEVTTDADDRADIVIRAGDVTHLVEVKTRRDVNVATARQLAVENAKELEGSTRLLVAARTTTAEARTLLEDAGISVIDSQGNMRVVLPGVFLWAEGHDDPIRSEPKEPPVRLAGRAGLAAQTLMHSPERLWKVHDLASQANISVGLAHRVFKRLEREQLIDVQGAGPNRTRRLSNPSALLDLWAEEMHDRRVKQIRAFRLARDPRVLALTLSSALTAAKIDHAVTGAAAGIRLAPFITAVPVTEIWVSEATGLGAVADAVQADVVMEGHNIIFRHAADDTPLAFRQRVDDVWLANSFRVFYDLRQDPRRGREQANRLREEVIGF